MPELHCLFDAKNDIERQVLEFLVQSFWYFPTLQKWSARTFFVITTEWFEMRKSDFHVILLYSCYLKISKHINLYSHYLLAIIYKNWNTHFFPPCKCSSLTNGQPFSITYW